MIIKLEIDALKPPVHPVLFLLALFAMVTWLGAPAEARSAKVERQFQDWLQGELWPQAQARGVSKATFQRAFQGVTLNWKLPDLVPPGTKAKTPKKQRQAEFGAPAGYFSEKRMAGLAAGGKSRRKKYARTLAAIEKTYGVPGHIVLAIWARESGYGGAKIPHDAFQVLGTKAFMSTRKDLFLNEVLAALEMAERGDVDARAMKSSWAGALGQPQFLPSSYLRFAVDFDGDGRRDIWNSVPDTLASIANYLASYDWRRGRDWGFEVNLPAGVNCALEGPDQGRRIADWAAAGLNRVSGKAFPAHEAKGEGYLMAPAGRYGPAFVVTPNFYVLKEYNESDLYALFVGHLGDRIAFGSKRFSAGWGKVGTLYRSDVAAMQRALEKKGYDVGGADGLAGFRTRRSIGDWQLKNGLKQTCFPDAALVKALR